MSYKCACYAYLNLYLEKYGYHFRYFNHSKFLEDYQQMLFERKYSADEINEISQKLKALQDSKKQEDSKAYDRLQKIKSQYIPLHKNIFTFNEGFLEDSFKKLVESCKRGEKDLIESMKYPNDEVDVFTFRVFNKQFISLFMEEIDHVSQYKGIVLGRPNSMNHNGVLMKELGLDGMLTVLREEYLQPIVDVVFGDVIGECESHRGFTVKYSYDGSVHDGTGDKQLGKHYDNAEVTLNVCMQADDCIGSDLVFMGMANSEEQDRERIHLSHEVGTAILHLGQLRHYVTPIERGVRTNLVLWLRSSAVRNKVCPMCWDTPEIVETKCVDDGFRP